MQHRGGKPRGLSKEDRRLWQRVARTATPLSDDRAATLKDEMARLMGETALPEPPAKPSPTFVPSVALEPVAEPQLSKPGPVGELDKSVLKKLAKGRRPVDSRIDLHGMTQDRARAALLTFLEDGRRSGYRLVLVITGKGNEGRGVLREAVPRWLSTAPFARLVSSQSPAHASHGGDGARYVRLRKRR